MPPYQGFVGPSYVSQSLVADAERLVNWYVAPIESQGARVPNCLYPTPGSQLFLNTPQVGGRGIFAQTGRAFAVIGTKLKEVFADMTTIDRGDVLQDNHPVQWATNGDGGNQLVVASAEHLYLLDLATNAFSNPTNGVTFVGMVDEFFIGLDALTSTLRVSDSLNGLVWDPLQIQQRSDASDPWVSMLIVEPEIWLFGEATTGIWYDKGTSPFPLAPRQGLIIKQGIGAPRSAAVYDGQPIWLGTSPDGSYVFYMAQGYTANPISTEAVENAMSGYVRVDDAEGYTYREKGHLHYVVNFPAARATWSYSAKGGWAERGTWNPVQNRYDAYHAQAHAFAFGKHLVTDRTTGGIYETSVDFGLDVGGVPLRRLRSGPGLYQAGQKLFVSNFMLDVQRGLGTGSGQGTLPQVMFQYSWDGGQTWGNERFQDAGRQGEYGGRTLWPALGSGEHFVPRIVVSDPIPWRVMGANYNVPYGAIGQ